MELLMPVMSAKEYTIKDKYGYAMGSLLSLEQPMNQRSIPLIWNETVLVPGDSCVYLPRVLRGQAGILRRSKAYMNSCKAPHKAFYSLKNPPTAHFLEEPERFMEIVRREVLKNEGCAL